MDVIVHVAQTCCGARNVVVVILHVEHDSCDVKNVIIAVLHAENNSCDFKAELHVKPENETLIDSTSK